MIKGINYNGKFTRLLSLMNAYIKNKNKEEAIIIENSSEEEKNQKIKDIIMNINYSLTDLDMFLVLKFYNVPALLLSLYNAGKGSSLNKEKQIFNTSINSEKYYTILFNKKMIDEKILLCMNNSNEMKIKSNMINQEKLLKGVTNIEDYLKESVKKIEISRKKQLEKDKNKIGKKKGKMKLPSK